MYLGAAFDQHLEDCAFQSGSRRVTEQPRCTTPSARYGVYALRYRLCHLLDQLGDQLRMGDLRGVVGVQLDRLGSHALR